MQRKLLKPRDFNAPYPQEWWPYAPASLFYGIFHCFSWDMRLLTVSLSINSDLVMIPPVPFKPPAEQLIKQGRP